MTISKSRKPTCQTCRERKVRCDGGVASCQRCISSGRQCSYRRASKREISFRHSRLSLLVQRDLPQGTLSESYSPPLVISRFSTGAGASPPEQCDIHGPHTATPNTEDSAPVYNFESHSPPLTSTPLAAQQSNDLLTTSRSPFIISPSGQSFCAGGVHPLAPIIWDRDPSIQLSSLEAECLQYYVDEIGPWLDSTSPERHFTYTVPRLALRSNVLFYSIIACAAHILRLTSGERTDLKEAEELYQQEAVQLLIPILDNVEFNNQNEVVFAAIGTLRMSEQWEEFVDQQCHLVPNCFISYGPLEKSSTSNGGLREATFYAYIRADIRMAILNRCCTKMQPSTWPLDTSMPSSDADWANRATWLLLQTINLCYGEEIPGVATRKKLEALVDNWKESIPDGFKPYILQYSNTDSFPVIKLLSPWHVVGLQFYHASKILLVTSNPVQPAFSGIISFNKYISANVLSHARSICAIAFSNKDFGTRINGSHLVTLAGQYFTGHEERSRVLQYMNMLQDVHAWPSKACLDMLDQAYGETVSGSPSSSR